MATIKRIREDVELPKYQTEGAAGFDLATAEPVFIEPGEIRLVPTGLVIKAPPEHMIMVVARSSLARKHGLSLSNSVGIVDEDFCGDDDEMMLSLHNITQRSVFIARGERLAQGIFVRVTREPFTEVTETMAATRGGWGSTG